MKLSEAQPILAAYSYLQHGLVTSAQASKEGIDTTTVTRLAQRDYLRRIRRGVYILSSVAEDSPTEIRAAWLSTRPGILAEERFQEDNPIVVSHVSAASVLELGDITPATHTFTSSKRKQSSAADISHRTADLRDEDWMIVRGLPVTTVARTIRDLARDHLDGDQLYHVMADGIHHRRLSPSEIARTVDAYAVYYGSSSGDEMVAESLRRFPEHDSAIEARAYSAETIPDSWANMMEGIGEVVTSALARQLSDELFSSKFAPTGQKAALMQGRAKLSPAYLDAMNTIGSDLQQIFRSKKVLDLSTLETIQEQVNALSAGIVEQLSAKKHHPVLDSGDDRESLGRAGSES